MADKKMVRLPQAELDIMLIIWEAGETVTSPYVLSKLKGKRSWSLPTLITVLVRLVDKGFLSLTKEGRRNKYTAIVDGDEYKAMLMKDTIENIYNGSVQEMLKSLIASGTVTADDIKKAAKQL